MKTTRISHLYALMQQNGLDALVLNPGPSFAYLTGMQFSLMERPVILFLSPEAEPVLVLPELEAIKLSQSDVPVKGITFGDNPATWGGFIHQACQAMQLEGKKVGVEPTRLRYLELRLLEEAVKAQFVSAEAVISGLRIQKEPSEIELMRKAVKIAQDALANTLPIIKAGRTEKEVASELLLQLLKAGSDPDLAFAPIVASGPNSANPHAFPTGRKLQAGDLLVIDWGAAYQGYISDLTRTFAIGKVEPEFQRIAGIVEQANAAGRAASRPEITAGEVDKATRKVIDDSGYGKYFTHRTGHGIGLEGHEPPFIFNENTGILKEGMAFTVEPGIYLAGRGGVRIEDNVVITASRAEILSDFPRQLRTLE